MRAGTERPGAAPIRVLYVDDDELLLELTRDFLETRTDGIEVAVESSASDALDRLETESFDAVVSDYQMPGLDGLEFLETLRQERDDDVPFIVFTGKGREEVAMEAVNLGADRYLQKGGDATSQYGILAQAIKQEVEHHRTELELRQREENLRITLDSIGDGVIATDAEGTVTRMNRVAEELTEWSRDAAAGKALRDVFEIRNQETRERVDNPVDTVLEEGRTVDLANGTLLVGREGTERHIADSAAPIVDGDDVVGVVLVFRDVTDRYLEQNRQERQSEALLELSTDDDLAAGRFDEVQRTITETVSETLDVDRVSVWFLDEDHEVLRCSDLYEMSSDTHQSGQELLAPTFPRYFDALESNLVVAAEDAQADPRTSELGDYLEDLDIRSMLDATIRSEGEVIGVVCHEHVGECRRWTDDERRFAKEVSGLVLRALANRDKRRREGELEQRNRTLEDLVDILSHDLQSPLMAARGSIELAEETGECAYLERAKRSLTGLENLVEGTVTLAESGWSAENAEPVRLAAASEDVWRRLDEGRGNLDVDVDDEFRIVASRDGLQPLLQNLFENAVRHAEGPVTVRVEGDDHGFSVADDGPGIPEEERATAFDFGYTTHPDGTGFGLAIVERIADAHGWTVSVEESANGGARFAFRDADVVRSK
jgi:PAS domain S-box-containing protein